MSNTPRLSTPVVSLTTDDIFHCLINDGTDCLRATAFVDSLSQEQLDALAEEVNNLIVDSAVFTAALDQAMLQLGHFSSVN